MIKQVDNRKLWCYCGVIIVAVLVFFSPSLLGKYQPNWDDPTHFIKNPAVLHLNLASLQKMFILKVCHVYIPLTSLSFAIEKQLFGFQPGVSHLINMLFHSAVGCLAMLLGIRLGLRPFAALLSALLFVLHPMRVESVAWVAERKDVLYAFFYLLALHAWWIWMDRRRKRYWVATFMFGALSMLAKPMGVTLPLMMCLLAWYRDGKWRERLGAILPVLLLAFVIGGITHADNYHEESRPFGEDVLLRLWSLGFYIWKFFFPAELSPYYGYPTPIGIGSWEYGLSAIFLMAIGYLLWLRRADRLLLLAGGWYVLSICVVLLANTVVATNIVADRFMYLPSLGLCYWIGAWAADRLTRPISQILLSVVLLVLGLMTFYQCHVWQDSETLLTDIIRHSPNKWNAYMYRGHDYGEAGRFDLAIQDHTMALAYFHSPWEEATTYYVLGIDHRYWADQLRRAGQYGESRRHYQLSEQNLSWSKRLGYDHDKVF
jgi:protein O-mannosyl-transferase